MLKYLLFLIYPLIIFISFLLIYKKYKNTILDNIKPLLINTIVISMVICLGLFIFLSFEDTIYTYDYAGHWIRSLEIKNLFINNPSRIPSLVYDSMNNMDYSYLPALFNFPFLLIKEGFRWFSLTNYLLFLLPAIILLQILYFDKTTLNKYLPIILAITIYPLYLTLFYGKVDACGLFFVTMCYALVIFPKTDEISILDNLAINLFAFLAVFLRRWYLYSVLCFYVVYFIKLLIEKDKNLFKGFILSFVLMAVVVLLFFRNFLVMSLTNNFAEAYQFYNRDNKLLSFINYLSPIILTISLLGIYKEFKDDKLLLTTNLISIIVPCVLVWGIQSFEFHHYYIFLLNILILFISGIIFITDNKKIIIIPVLLIMIIQTSLIFTNTGSIPLLTSIRKTPEVLENKNELIELSSYIKSIEPDEYTTAFIAGGSYGIITDDLLRNATLPNLDMPNIDSSVFDIRDGFPKDMQFIKYVVLINPSLYMDKEYQHMYDVISDAITNNRDVSSIYNKIKEMPINDDYVATIYERTGDFTPEIKQYFYDQMISYYPDKKDFFSYILD